MILNTTVGIQNRGEYVTGVGRNRYGFVMSQRGCRSTTFAVDITVTPCQAPIKVIGAYSLYVAVAGAMEQHSLIDLTCFEMMVKIEFYPLNKQASG